MKKIIVNIMFTTGSALVILASFFAAFNLKEMQIITIFQILGANIFINCGLFFIIKNIESRYVIIEYVLHISYIIIILILFGAIFDWFSAIPVWVLVIMAVVIYLFTIGTSIAVIKKETNEINKLLQKRKEKMEDI